MRVYIPPVLVYLFHSEWVGVKEACWVLNRCLLHQDSPESVTSYQKNVHIFLYFRPRWLYSEVPIPCIPPIHFQVLPCDIIDKNTYQYWIKKIRRASYTVYTKLIFLSFQYSYDEISKYIYKGNSMRFWNTNYVATALQKCSLKHLKRKK